MKALTFRKLRTGTGIFLTIIIPVLVLLIPNYLSSGTGSKSETSSKRISSLTSPTRIALGNKNLVYVSDYLKKRVITYKLINYKFKAKREIKINGFPLGIAVYNNRFIFVGNSSINLVQVYRRNGKYAYKFPVKAGKPNDIAISENKKVFVVASDEDLIKVYDIGGKFIFSFGGKGSGNGEFDFPTGIAIDGYNSEVIISDFMNKRIQVFDMDGNWKRTFGGGMFMSIVDRPQGISLDNRGNYHIVDSQQACIHVFNFQGSCISSYGNYGKDTGQLRTPLDIVIGQDGSAFVTSNLNKRVEIFKEIAK